MHLEEESVGVHKLLDFIGEGSKFSSCSAELLQVDHICNILSRM